MKTSPVTRHRPISLKFMPKYKFDIEQESEDGNVENTSDSVVDVNEVPSMEKKINIDRMPRSKQPSLRRGLQLEWTEPPIVARNQAGKDRFN